MKPLIYTCLLSMMAVTALTPIAQTQQYKTEFYPFQTNSAYEAIQVDLNGDGIPDFIRSDSKNQELLSTGNGAFVAHTYPQVRGGGPFGTPVAGGDFNNDGKADVVFVEPLGVAYGDGRGNFTSYQELPVNIGINDAQAQVADFNGDGRPDVAIAYDTGTGSPTFVIILLINNGHGFNNPVTIYTQGSGGSPGYEYTTPLDLLLGDFDSDGKADLVLRTTEADPNMFPGSLLALTALYGTGTGKFTPKTILTTTSDTFQMSSADMNNDGNSDLVAFGSTISIFYGQRNRTFARTTIGNHGAQGNPILADFDGDGRKDIVYPLVSNAAMNNLEASAFLQTAPGVFTQQASYPIGDTYNAAAGEVPFNHAFVGDYNRDGRPDAALLSANNELQHPLSMDVLLNKAGVPDGSCKAPAPIGIAVCSPLANQTFSGPVNFSFAATSFYSVRKMEVWVDGVKRSETYEVFGDSGFSNVKLSLSPGAHHIDLYAVGFDQTYLHKTYNITVK